MLKLYNIDKFKESSQQLIALHSHKSCYLEIKKC